MSIYYPANPVAMLKTIIRNRHLLWELSKRDFIGRYKGSVLGVAWSLFNPLLMLVIYTFVFSVAFKAKWGTGDDGKINFAIVLFSGMIVHSFFAECLNRAPGLIVGHPNYVKKVVFPLELLPWMTLLTATFHLLISFGVLLLFCLMANVTIHVGTLLVPIILVPLILMMLGVSWIFASLGVYLRDLSQVIGMFTTVALFLSPVFYPVEILPHEYRILLSWNPITLPILQIRELMLWGNPPKWSSWAISLGIGAALFQIGYWWFQKSRRGFADVL